MSMKIIALTGTNWHAQSEVVELILAQSTHDGRGVFVVTDIDDATYLPNVHAQGHQCELWRVGDDTSRPTLNSQVTAHITPADLAGDLPAAVARELAVFYSQTAAAGSTTPAQEQPA